MSNEQKTYCDDFQKLENQNFVKQIVVNYMAFMTQCSMNDELREEMLDLREDESGLSDEEVSAKREERVKNINFIMNYQVAMKIPVEHENMGFAFCEEKLRWAILWVFPKEPLEVEGKLISAIRFNEALLFKKSKGNEMLEKFMKKVNKIEDERISSEKIKSKTPPKEKYTFEFSSADNIFLDSEIREYDKGLQNFIDEKEIQFEKDHDWAKQIKSFGNQRVPLDINECYVYLIMPFMYIANEKMEIIEFDDDEIVLTPCT